MRANMCVDRWVDKGVGGCRSIYQIHVCLEDICAGSCVDTRAYMHADKRAYLDAGG